MEAQRPNVPRARWKAIAQDGLPVLGSAALLAFAVACGLVMLPL